MTDQQAVLAADIGGTKVNMALYDLHGDTNAILAEGQYKSADYSSFADLLADFLRGRREQIGAGCIGVAGPVSDGSVHLTKLPWSLDERQLQDQTGIAKIVLLNDLVATVYGLPSLQPSQLKILHHGQSKPGKTIAVIAPGTGLGEAFGIFDGKRFHPQPSEGGHVNFAPADRQQSGLLTYLQKSYDHVSYDLVCSGRGIPLIYAYLRSVNQEEDDHALAQRIEAADDPAPLIVEAALAGSSLIARKTVEMFVDILAAEAGNLVLKTLAIGGLYLGGGIPPRLVEFIDAQRFVQIFSNKGPVRKFVEDVPIHLILEPKTALYGCRNYAVDLCLKRI